MSNLYGSIPPTVKQLSPDEMTALNDVKNFSILAIVGFLVDMVSVYLGISYLIGTLSSGFYSSQPLTSSLSAEITILPFSAAAIVLLIVSFVFLRSGYRHLKGTSERFSSPYTGVNLYFIGLIVLLAGLLVSVVYILGGGPFTLILGGIAIIFIGSIISLVGEIMGLIVGAFRLRDHFNKSAFGTAGIMFIVGIFIPLFSFVGAILVYRGSSSILNEKRSTQT